MKTYLDYELLKVGTYSLKLYNVLSFLIFIAIALVVMNVVKRLIYRSKSLETSKKYTVHRLTRYVAAVIVVVISLRLLGFNISVLLAGSAALLVGVGFGLQNLFSDFISGVILLMDGTLKVGDIIEVNGMIYKVQEINFRTTTVIGREENYVILPNAYLTGNSVVNWTYNEVASRFKINIGVAYSTDVPALMQLLKDVALSDENVLEIPEPFVRFEDYGDSALMFALYFYANDIFRVENIKSKLRVEIFKALADNNITIPFPQRVLHVKKTKE
jgi:small-conductance mechanosensitive channel